MKTDDRNLRVVSSLKPPSGQAGPSAVELKTVDSCLPVGRDVQREAEAVLPVTCPLSFDVEDQVARMAC